MMKRRSLGMILSMLLGPAVAVQLVHSEPGEEIRMNHARGTFEVDVKPLPGDEKVPGLGVGRMSYSKQWRGDLEGTSKGEMMTAGGAEGSGGYVAIEQVECTVS